jgi:hypothetical protein
VALPVPAVAEVIAIHEAWLVAVQVQAEAVVTAIGVPAPPAAGAAAPLQTSPPPRAGCARDRKDRANARRTASLCAMMDFVGTRRVWMNQDHALRGECSRVVATAGAAVVRVRRLRRSKQVTCQNRHGVAVDLGCPSMRFQPDT